MNCFVATAFDHDDVDAIYDEIIDPVVTTSGLRPQRVDRVEHNDDIDDAIIELINSSALCIVDLTYARPSVYYEAGYAHGLGIPVIYLARSDHFRPRIDDPHGNLKVHFDLQMKNIIRWTKPGPDLAQRLRSRIAHVTKATRKKMERDALLNADRVAFQSQSVNSRIIALSKRITRLVQARGFTRGDESDLRYARYDASIARLQKDDSRTQSQVVVMAVDSLTAQMTQLAAMLCRRHGRGVTSSRPRATASTCIVLSLRSIMSNTLAARLRSWTPVSDKVLRQQYTSDHGSARFTDTIVVVDRVRSEADAAERCRRVIDDL